MWVKNSENDIKTYDSPSLFTWININVT